MVFLQLILSLSIPSKLILLRIYKIAQNHNWTSVNHYANQFYSCFFKAPGYGHFPYFRRNKKYLQYSDFPKMGRQTLECCTWHIHYILVDVTLVDFVLFS